MHARRNSHAKRQPDVEDSKELVSGLQHGDHRAVGDVGRLGLAAPRPLMEAPMNILADLRRLAPDLVAAIVIGATACSVTGWAVTAHQLNALISYQPVGAEALRALREKDDPAVRVRQQRGRAGDRHRLQEVERVFPPLVCPPACESPV